MSSAKEIANILYPAHIPNFFAEQQHHQASGATNQLSRAHVLCRLSAIDGRPPHHGFLLVRWGLPSPQSLCKITLVKL